MSEESYDELWNLDWVGIPDYPYVMKYKFEEDSYVLAISNLAAVYAEKLDKYDVQDRFQLLNPYAEMLPKVILKHVKQLVNNIFSGDQARNQTELRITLDSERASILVQFNTSGVRFMFNFKPQRLSDNQFMTHILRPTLLRALILDEEKAALQRKVEELEGRQYSSSSSRSNERKNIKAMYSEIKEISPPESGAIEAFLCLHKEKITLPESLTPNVSPMKRIHSSSTSSSIKIKGVKNKAKIIPYEEGNSDINLESQNRIQQLEEPEMCVSLKLEHSNKNISPMKREMDEDNQEETVSKPAPCLKPSLTKKKKFLKF